MHSFTQSFEALVKLNFMYFPPYDCESKCEVAGQWL